MQYIGSAAGGVTASVNTSNVLFQNTLLRLFRQRFSGGKKTRRMLLPRNDLLRCLSALDCGTLFFFIFRCAQFDV